MYVIGLTGGIASGKSTVADMLEKKGAALLSADLVGHEVYQPGRPAWQELVDAFGRQVVAADGTIDRKALGGIVFSDRDSLQRLNAITHPRMKQLMEEKLSELQKRGVRVVVLEAALLFDADWDGLADEVWVTVVPSQVAAERAAERSKISVEQALARIKTQMSDEERMRRSRVVLNTDCAIETTQAQTADEWDRLRQRLESAAAMGSVPGQQEG